MTQQWPDAPTPTDQETAAVNSKPVAWAHFSNIKSQITPEMKQTWAEDLTRDFTIPLYAAPPAEPLSDEQIEPLFRQINDMRAVGEKDEWFWFAWGVEMGERAHGIRSSGARHSAGTDRPGSNEKESDATWLEEVERLIDEYGRARWDTGCAESAFDKLGARRYDQDAVDAKTELLAKLRERLKEA
jgi:hypothetical protein